MSTDTRTLAERAEVQARACMAMAMYGVAALLREQQAEIERLTKIANDQAGELDSLGVENFALAANSCLHGAIVGDEGGNSYCTIAKERDSLRRDLEAARAELADRREHMRRGMQSGINTARARGEGNADE